MVAEEIHDREQLYQAALTYLSHREYSTLELTSKLQQKGYDDVAIAEVIRELISAGYLSEYRYCEQVIRKWVSKGHGINKIILECEQNNITMELLNNTLMEMNINWTELIYQQWQKKFKKQRSHSDEERSKQVRFLTQRGFTEEDITNLFNHYLEDRIDKNNSIT